MKRNRTSDLGRRTFGLGPLAPKTFGGRPICRSFFSMNAKFECHFCPAFWIYKGRANVQPQVGVRWLKPEVRRLTSEIWWLKARVMAEVRGLRSEVRSPIPIHRPPQPLLEIHFRPIPKMRFRLGDIGQRMLDVATALRPITGLAGIGRESLQHLDRLVERY